MTLFVDASFCPRTKAAGWGGWVICDRWPHGYTFGGAFPYQPRDNSEAELFGIAEATIILAEHNEFRGINFMTVQSDSVVALAWILNHVPHASAAKQVDDGAKIGDGRWNQKMTRMRRAQIDMIAHATFGVPLWLRHVRGHGGNASARSRINEQCHNIAYSEMDKQRKIFRASGVVS